jgi:hydroxymethylbilane synthase
LPDGLELVAFLERADPRDVLIARDGLRLRDLPAGARVGSTSLRRRAQIGALRPDLELLDLRGNVDTRIRRLREGRFDAILLALAGLSRLGRAHEATEILEVETLLPAPGQGAIALECRTGDRSVAEAVVPLHHEQTARCVAAERALLAGLGGGCNVPLGAHAVPRDGDVWLRAFVAREDGSEMLRGEDRGRDPAGVGRALATDLIARGARALMPASREG